jgi:flagellar hook-associated protein 3 FlgL
MMVNDLYRSLNVNAQRLAAQQMRLATGRTINRPSDDPAALVRSLRLRTSLNEGEQYLENIGNALSFMQTSDDALSDLTDALQRARELTVQAATGTNDQGARTAIAQEIREIGEQLKQIANTRHGAKYIFAGSNVSVAPAQADGSWAGNDTLMSVEIATGVAVPYNLQASGFFAAPGEGLFDVMAALAVAMESGDSAGIQAGLSDIDRKLSEALTMQGSIGARINRMELQQNRLQNARTSLTELLANCEDADLAEVMMNLKTQEAVYQAALRAGAGIVTMSLADFLG